MAESVGGVTPADVAFVFLALPPPHLPAAPSRDFETIRMARGRFGRVIVRVVTNGASIEEAALEMNPVANLN